MNITITIKFIMRFLSEAMMFCGLLFASDLLAQTSVSQEFLTASEDEGHRTEISISAGLDVSKYSEKPSAESVKNRLGYNFGIGVNVPLYYFRSDCGLRLQTGLFVENKGAKEEYSGAEATYNTTYLQIPVMAEFRSEVARNTNVFINIGPYFAYGIGGNYDSNSSIMPTGSLFTNILNRFDCGLISGVGVVYSKIKFGVWYETGFVNISNVEDYSFKTRNLMFSLSYIF